VKWCSLFALLGYRCHAIIRSLSAGQKILHWFIRFGESNWTKFIGICVVCAAGAIHSADEHPETKKAIPLAIEQPLSQHPLLGLIGELLPVPAFLFALLIEKAKKVREGHPPENDVLLSIIEVLGFTVANKTVARHCAAAHALGCGNAAKLTKHDSTPALQTEALVHNVWQIFNTEAIKNGMTAPNQLKVTLAEMDDRGNFVKFLYFFPKNLYPGSDENLKKVSGFAHAAKNGGMIILENLAKELKSRKSRYAKSQIEEHNVGSVILEPISIQALDGIPNVPLVLSIKCDLPKVFRNKIKGART